MLAYTTTTTLGRIDKYCPTGRAIACLVNAGQAIETQSQVDPTRGLVYEEFAFVNPFPRAIQGGSLVWIEDAGEFPAVVTVYD